MQMKEQKGEEGRRQDEYELETLSKSLLMNPSSTEGEDDLLYAPC